MRVDFDDYDVHFLMQINVDRMVKRSDYHLAASLENRSITISNFCAIDSKEGSKLAVIEGTINNLEAGIYTLNFNLRDDWNFEVDIGGDQEEIIVYM